jgi:hypothetical protein
VPKLEIGVVPCALVFLDAEAAGSPNLRGGDAFGYVAQAVTLNRSLLAAGLPQLTVATNAIDLVDDYLSRLDAAIRPAVFPLRPSLDLAKETRFYGAHFKLDLLEQMARSLPGNRLLLLLDTDVIAQHRIDPDLLHRCHESGVGAFDISDQEFSAYGSNRVIDDLEMVAARRLRNPHWFGGECLLVSRHFIGQLVPVARACFGRYREVMSDLNHQGDEAFISAALNILSERGLMIIDIGAYRTVGRHWSGSTHRDLRWFKGCALLHLPGCKALLAQQANRHAFSSAHLWRHLVLKHWLNRLVWPLRLRAQSRRRDRARTASRLDALILDSDGRRVSRLARALTSRGLVVMCDDSLHWTPDAVHRLRPGVILVGGPLPIADVDRILDASTGRPRPLMIGYAAEDSGADGVLWDRCFQPSADVSVIVDAVVGALEHARET